MSEQERMAAAMTKRIRDWQESTSEFYARQNGNDAWVKGLVGYLLHGPGALLEAGFGDVAAAKAGACLIPCDDDCELGNGCHAAHLPRHKRVGQASRHDIRHAKAEALREAADNCLDIAFECNEDVQDWLRDRAHQIRGGSDA